MVTRGKAKDKGTRGETGVVRYLRENGFPHAERSSLKGVADTGDITGTPGITWEVKCGEQAKYPSVLQVDRWMAELERERINAGIPAGMQVTIGVLVMQRAGYAPSRAEQWNVCINLTTFARLIDTVWPFFNVEWGAARAVVSLETAVRILRFAGFGEPLDDED